MTSWHYAVDGKAQGPVPEQQLRELLRQGRPGQGGLGHRGLGPDTLLWTEGMAQWQKASEIAAFAAPAAAPAAPPQAQPQLQQKPAPSPAQATGDFSAAPTRHDTGFSQTGIAQPAAELRIDVVLRQSLSILKARLGFWILTGFLATLVVVPFAVILSHSTAINGVIILVQAELDTVITFVAFHACYGRNFGLGEALQQGSERFLPFLGIMALIMVVAFLGLVILGLVGNLFGFLIGSTTAVTLPYILFLVAGTMAGVRILVSTAVCVAEKAGPIVSIKRSVDLTDGSSWRIFGLLLIPVAALLLAILIAIGIGAAAIASAGSLRDATTSLTVVATMGLLVLLFFPFQWLFNAFMVILTTTTYVELRRTKEGFTTDSIAEVFE
ncbi:MAG: DUF4339 domain-containing protein [Alphaproteobacteria bacterium]|nr:DUF4339 domain-containing protein [Alphaproteobacteria bacterium]